jgi:choline transport protein
VLKAGLRETWNRLLTVRRQQTIAIAAFAAGFNIFLAKRLPMFEGIVLFVHLLGFFCVLIPLWVLAPMVPLREVFGAPGFADYGGWGSIGAACILGQLAASSAFVGVDSAAHMAEEVCAGVGPTVYTIWIH